MRFLEAEVDSGQARVQFYRMARSLLLFALAFALTAARGASPTGIEGRWLTFDAATHERRSVVEIRRDGARVAGRVAELFLRKDEDPDPACDRCEGPERGRRIRGLEILALEAATDGAGFRGTVLDPEEGRTYRCTVTIEDEGRTLRLRGYVGLPIFGRTETWSRTAD
jgi:uncharacterized protein (DUF2147 family)